MTANSVLIKARAAAERLMVDTCLIQRLAAVATDPETGVVTKQYSTIYSGKCRVQTRTILARQFNVAEAEVYMARHELHLPVDTSPNVGSDDIITITVATHDADLSGRKYHAAELGHKTYASARRFSIIEITS